MLPPHRIAALAVIFLFSGWLSVPLAIAGRVIGHISDETGGALPGVVVQLRSAAGTVSQTVSDRNGDYSFESVVEGIYAIDFSLVNFGNVTHRDFRVTASTVRQDEVMHLALNAEVIVVGRQTFMNLADVEDPAANLVGIAQSASQGAITGRQLEVRPFMRQGEVLETVPGVIITQHSGEGKANQYFLRGFNLDHGSDFATTVAGVPVNMPTHAHSQGYSDINFLIPELVAGVQYSKGPYYADQGDFATAGAANINYATTLDRPLARIETGTYGFGRVLLAASPRFARGHVLVAGEVSTNSGPWTVPDLYRKVNAVARYSRGDNTNGVTLTATGYRGTWNATEASPERAVASGLIDRFGSIDPSDGGRTYRYSISGEWQRSNGTTLTKVSAYGLGYGLNLISNFTFYLDDPVHGDQKEQVDRRFVTGVKASRKRIGRFRGRLMQTMYGAHLRNDDVAHLALYHTESRVRLGTLSDASAMVTSAGLFAQSDIEWSSHVRTTIGARGDGTRFKVAASDPANSGTTDAGILSPKAAITIGPWRGTEFYLNGGTGFHSNNALGTTITRDAAGDPVSRVTPLVRAKGAEVGVRTVVVPHLQTTVALWMLRLGSELVYNGDVGATEPGPASARRGIEVANYYSPRRWLVFDGDVSWSHARFSDDTGGGYVPEAVGLVVSAGASIDNLRKASSSIRLRYFGPRTLVEDNSVQSAATTLINAEGGYQLSKHLRASLQIYNVFDAPVSDIDYYFASRLPSEPPEGVEDIHTHPAVPRTARLSVVVGF